MTDAVPEPTSETLRGIARQRLAQRSPSGPDVNYPFLAERFRSEAAIDPAGFGQLVTGIEMPGGILPPVPPTFRGRVGRLLVLLEHRTLWWLVRAISHRDRLWRAAYDMMLAIHEKQLQSRIEAAERMAGLEARLAKIERSLSGAKSRDGSA